MPKLKRKKASGSPGEWYVDIPNYGAGPPVYTLQVRPAGRDILLSSNLDHDSTPKRTAHVDWDLYRTLDDLGLLFTKGEESDTASDELQPADERSVEDLSPGQRIAFARGLVENQPVELLVESERILELFRSLSSDVSGHGPLLTEILMGTPFEPDAILNIDTWADEYAPARTPDIRGRDSTLLALVVKLVFEILASTAWSLFESIVSSRECHELWLFDEYFAIGGNELVLHPVAEHINQGLTESGREQLEKDSLDNPGPLYNRFLETIYPSLSKGQLQSQLESYGTTVDEEVFTGHFLMFPKPANRTDSEFQAIFNEM